MADAKLERLLNLTAALLDTPRLLTADELRERVGGYPEERASFRRQFERDKETLREMGVPLVVEDIPGRLPPLAGYRILPEQYYLPDPGLTPEELAALHLAMQTVRVDGLSGATGIWKLGGTVGADDVTPPAVEVTLPADPNLEVLFQAIEQRRAVRITTRGATREVEPSRLDYTRGRWYLQGFDRLRDTDRVYRLDRLEGLVEPTGPPDAFEPQSRGAPALEPWQTGDDAPLDARLLVDTTVAPWLLQRFGEDVLVERRPDGQVVLQLRVTNRAGFRSLVLGLGEHGEVLGPEELRADLVAWLRACVEAGA